MAASRRKAAAGTDELEDRQVTRLEKIINVRTDLRAYTRRLFMGERKTYFKCQTFTNYANQASVIIFFLKRKRRRRINGKWGKLALSLF